MKSFKCLKIIEKILNWHKTVVYFYIIFLQITLVVGYAYKAYKKCLTAKPTAILNPHPRSTAQQQTLKNIIQSV